MMQTWLLDFISDSLADPAGHGEYLRLLVNEFGEGETIELAAGWLQIYNNKRLNTVTGGAPPEKITFS